MDITERLRASGWCQVKEASQITGLRPRQIYRFIEKYGIPTQRIGGDGSHPPGKRGEGSLYLKLAPLLSVMGKQVATIALAHLIQHPPPPPPLSFTMWLKQQQPRQDPVGDFARHWAEIDRRPRSSDWGSILGRICEFWHADEAAKALTPAWEAYQLYCAERMKERATHDIKESTRDRAVPAH